MTKTRRARLRYWLAWKIMPVDREVIQESLSDEIPDTFPEEYDTVDEVAYLIGLTEDNWFD